MNTTNRLEGIDDVLAVLLALSARPEELELLLISVSYGNVGVQRYACQFARVTMTWLTCSTSCLRNVVAMFHVLAKEKAWRKEQGNMGFLETMSKPIVAVGADHPLEEEQLMADYYRVSPILRGTSIVN